MIKYYRDSCIRKSNKFDARFIMIGCKAASIYHNAKKIINIITALSHRVNNNLTVWNLFKVVFSPNYNLNSFWIINIPAELSYYFSKEKIEE